MNSYDRVSSWLVSLLILFAVSVAMLLIVYFARRLIVAQVAIPVTPVEAAGPPGDAAMGLARDLEPPGIDEVPDLLEPQLEQTLTALAAAVSNKTALLADESIEGHAASAFGQSLGDNRRAGHGLGDFGDGEGGYEPEREVRFEPENLRHYAQFLDFFKIELGVLGRDNKIHYAYNLSREVPGVRVGAPVEEQRLYMNSARGRFAPLDRELVERAGVADRGPITLQFYPDEAAAILYSLEKQRAGERRPEEIRRTVFRVTPTGDRFEFSVEAQSYHSTF